MSCPKTHVLPQCGPAGGAGFMTWCPARCSPRCLRVGRLPRLRVYQDLHRRVVVLDQGRQALGDQVVQGDASGDERQQVDVAALKDPDHRFVVAYVGDSATQVDLLEHHLLHVHGGWVAPDRHDDDDAGRSNRVDQGVECGLDAGTLEPDVGADAAGQLEHHVLDVLAGGVQDV